jgi:malate dehydrogenase
VSILAPDVVRETDAFPSARPMTVTVTGAAGQIGYTLLFRVAAGLMFGADTPVNLRLLEIPSAMRATEGVVMELEDCGFPLLRDIDITSDPVRAFEGANAGVLIGAKPRTVGMERADLLAANASIFAVHGRAISEAAADDVRVVVVGNPVNANALVLAHHAPDLPKQQITAVSRLDHNRAVFQLARRAGVPTSEVSRLAIWGNHSSTMYPDITHAVVGGRSGAEYAADTMWLEMEFIPSVANRGSAIIEVRGQSSQGSAAFATKEHMYDWFCGTRPGDWTSAGVWSSGEYGIPDGLVCSMPVTSDGSGWTVVEGLNIDPLSRRYIDTSIADLLEEREMVKAMGLI